VVVPPAVVAAAVVAGSAANTGVESIKIRVEAISFFIFRSPKKLGLAKYLANLLADYS